MKAEVQPNQRDRMPGRRRERFTLPILAVTGIEREMEVFGNHIEQAAFHNEPVLLAELGPGNGPEVTILVGVHGNETVSFEIAATLLQKTNLTKGKLRLIVANTPAVVVNKRFIEQDLNRISPGANTAENGEMGLAPKLLDLITTTGEKDAVVIDLHTASVSTPAFAIVNRRDEKALQLAESTGVSNIVLMQSDDFGTKNAGSVTEQLPLGIGIELGKHGSTQAYKEGLQAVQQILVNLDMVSDKKSLSTTEKHYFRITGRAPRFLGQSVIFDKNFTNFTPVTSGQDLYIVSNEENYFTQIAKATTPFVPILISTMASNPLFLMGKEVAREHLMPETLNLEELRHITSALDFPQDIQQQLHEAVVSAFGRPDFEREDSLGHLQGDYFQIIRDNEKVIGFSSLEIGTPKDLLNLSPTVSADIRGGYFAAAVLEASYQGKGLYSMMNKRRLDAILSEDLPLLFTRTQNPRVEEGIVRLLDQAVRSGQLSSYSLERISLPEVYGRSLTGYIPHSSVEEIQREYGKLNYQKGDAYALFFHLKK